MNNLIALPNYSDDFFDSQTSDMGRFSVIITGKTGVGKSYLINALFNEKVADTGIGLPITQEMTKFDSKIHPLSIFDTKGIELGNYEEIVNQITDEISSRMEKKGKMRPGELIHAVWYCINSASSRLEQLEINFIKRLYLNAGVHIYIILTQTTSKKKADAFISSIESILYQNIGSKWNEKVHIVKVLAGDDETDAGVVKSFGLDDLIRLNMDTLPSSVRFLLATAQQHNKQIKHDEAIRITESYVKTNGIKGFLMRIPIIGNIYVAIEINQRVDKLITKICELYEIDIRKIKNEMEDGGILDGKVKEAKKSLYAQYIPFLNTFTKDDISENFFRELGTIVSDVAEEAWRAANEKDIRDAEVVAKNFARNLQEKLIKSFGK